MLWFELPSISIHTGGKKNRLLASFLCLALLGFLNWESLEFSGFRQPRRGSVVNIVSQSGWKNRTEQSNDVVASGDASDNADSKMIHPAVPHFAPPNNHHHIAYSSARHDRSGSAISNMLAAHAYAFHHNMTYGGACLRLPENVTHFTKQKFEKNIEQHQALINAIGLNGILGFLHCSTNQTAALIPRKRYMEADAFWYTPEWLDDMHQHIDYPLLSKQKKKNSNSTRLQIAMHVRRGDIQPCNRWSHRYLPNSYYQRILDEYIVDDKKTAQITIFSEKNSKNFRNVILNFGSLWYRWQFGSWRNAESDRYHVKFEICRAATSRKFSWCSGCSWWV